MAERAAAEQPQDEDLMHLMVEPLQVGAQLRGPRRNRAAAAYLPVLARMPHDFLALFQLAVPAACPPGPWVLGLQPVYDAMGLTDRLVDWRLTQWLTGR